MKRNGCPVCGYRILTNEKCNSCGNQLGIDFDKNTLDVRFLRLRTIWIESGCKWHGENSLKPVDWSPYAQMRKEHLTYPISSTLNTFYEMRLINNNDLIEWAKSYDIERPFFSDLSLFGHIKMFIEEKISEINLSTKYAWTIPKRKFNYSEEFALRTHSLNIDDPREAYHYIKWISENSIGLDTNKMDVSFGNQMNKYFSHKGDIDPYDYLASRFDEFKESTKKLNDELWDEIK